tara:strand:- start:4421 stop:5116 length:696 start_codon:yes stop_codon:yes gene_type:complete
MNQNAFRDNDGSNPIEADSQSNEIPSRKWARLIHDHRMSRLTIEGVSSWSALTAVAAVMESPRMEVMLGLDAGPQFTDELGLEAESPPLRYAVCVDGPIEEADAKAIEKALISGTSLIDADIRTAASVLNKSGVIEIQSRSDQPLLAVIAEMMRGHLSQIMSCSPMDFPLPDPDLIDHLMSATGRLAIHPLETDVYPEFIDLGLALPETEVVGPATTSVVFDRCSRTWHSE